MYNDYFGFREPPFSIAPDPRYLYLTEQHREALAHLTYGFNSDGGCILLTGEVGTGKTTACRCLLEQLPDHVNIALVLNPKVSATELLEIICDELKIDYPQQNNTNKTYIDRINRYLLEANARGEKTVLIIDEAQNLDTSVLEQLRLLTNLETNQRKLLQIIILGQPELLEILSRPELRQLAQRITARFHLRPLSGREVKDYITHRLAVAGQNVQLFPEPVIKKLYRLSKGVPRLINVLCDRALLGAYVQNKPAVDMVTLETAAREVFGEIRTGGNNTRKKLLPWTAAIAATLAMAAVALYQFAPNSFIDAVSTGAVARTGQTPSDDEYSSNAAAVARTTEAAQPVHTGMDDADDSVTIHTAMATTGAESSTTPASSQVMGPDRATAAENINDNPFAEFIRNTQSDNLSRAYSALFRTWKRDYDISKHRDACDYAQTQGLSCLHKQGNLNSLRKMNRPAVLQLYKEDGSPVYVIVTRLDDHRATIDTGADRFEVSARSLDALWLGQYTVLWQKPPFYSRAVIPGSEGPVVQWLDQQLVRIFGHSNQPTIHDTYNDTLVSQVKKFQQSKGLIPDGVVGPVTCIYLNTELGSEAPSLSSRGS